MSLASIHYLPTKRAGSSRRTSTRTGWKEDIAAFRDACEAARLPVRDRAFAVGRGGPCLVLLRCSGIRSGGSPNGLLPAYPGDVEAPRSRHELLRQVVPESGHDASGRLRQPDRAAAATRSRGRGQHRIRRSRASPFSRSMGVPCQLATHSGVRRRTGRGRRPARRPDARSPHERSGGGRLGGALASSTVTPAAADDAGR